MILSPKQRAKRRWKAERKERAETQRELRRWTRQRVKKATTIYGILSYLPHTLYTERKQVCQLFGIPVIAARSNNFS